MHGSEAVLAAQLFYANYNYINQNFEKVKKEPGFIEKTLFIFSIFFQYKEALEVLTGATEEHPSEFS